MQAIAPPQAQPMGMPPQGMPPQAGIPQGIPQEVPQVTPTQALGQVKEEPPPIDKQVAIAADSLDVPKLRELAVQNFDTPVGQAAAYLHRKVKDADEKLGGLSADIFAAKTEPEKNLATAKALKSTKDHPQWGTALIAYIMGNKTLAVNLVTGGQVTSKTTYDNEGRQYTYSVDAMGLPVGIQDNNGNPVDPEEYRARGGGIDRVQDTYNYMNNAEINRQNTISLNKGVNNLNAFSARTQGIAQEATQASNFLSSINPELMSADRIRAVEGLFSVSKNEAKGSTTNRSRTEQEGSGTSNQESSGTGATVGGSLGRGGGFNPDGSSQGGTGVNVTGTKKDDTSKGNTTNNLDMTTGGGGTSRNNEVREMQDKVAFAKSMFFKDAKGEEIQKLTQVWNTIERAALSNAQMAQDGVKLPSFLTPQSPRGVGEGIEALQIRLQKEILNQKLLAGFEKFYRDNMEGHRKNASPPSMEQLENAYTKTKGPNGYQTIMENHIDEVADIVKRTQKDPERAMDIKYGPATGGDKPKAVAPPADKPKRRSLSDLEKEAGN